MPSVYHPSPSALAGALTAFEPDDAREQAFRARMLALLEERHDVFARSSFSPGHFTASAFILSPDDGELFLIRHPKLGLWLQPGGHVEPSDEDVLAAARREVEEEAGLADAALHPACPGVFDVDIHPIPARKDEPAHEHFDVRFLFRAPDKAAVRAGDEVHGGRWVALDAIEDAGSDGSVARAVAKVTRLASRGPRDG